MDSRGRDERALSPVVGVALMVVIVVALGVLTGGMLLGFQTQLKDPAPVFVADETIEVDLQGNDTEHTLEFVHRGGQAVPAGPLSVRLGAGGTTRTIDLDSTSAASLADGEWSAGERLDLELDESAVCRAGTDTAEVTLTYEREDSSYTLSERRVSVERGQFVIRGDTVETTADFTANVKFLGTGWSSTRYDAPVNTSVGVNGSEVKAWEMVGDSNTTIGAYGVSRQSAGTSISVEARGGTVEDARYVGPSDDYDYSFEQYGSTYYVDVTEHEWRTTSADENDEYLVVLRDGDSVPNFDADSGQQDVATYAESFVENGTISLDDNQAIYLFDFNRQGPTHETADYQDAVVLVSFFIQRTAAPQVHEVSGGGEVIVCPAETRSASP
ncbi:flagellin N-terminal-like domain-containing protein [Halogeometricum rufum]|uniref:Flagellin N-terminal-like domain-containing protein n=1 Tax=Halogeometricum rufum TaxID=553469 RepID=A0A1I6HRP4_9EURY|nr:type IV pilin N-terminal domain-containing protein [Halogeometricum rufum]SFR57141.1 flagellin N-terminal-like domain-containing protein [Halogeometricum rufum]